MASQLYDAGAVGEVKVTGVGLTGGLVANRRVTASRWAEQPFGLGQGGDGVADAGQALARDPLDLGEPAERLDRQAARTPRQAAGRQDVVGAGRVVAGRFRRPRPDEQRAGVAEAGHGRLEGLDIDREVLWGVVVDERDRGVEVWRQDDAAVLAERARQDVAPGRAVAGGPRPRARRRPRRPPIVVTRSAGESGPCSAWVMRSRATKSGRAGGAARTTPSDGPAGRSMPTSPLDLDLGGGHPGVARPDDARDRLDAGVRQAVGEGADRLGATGHDERIDARAARRRRAGPGRVPLASAGEATTMRSTPATRAGTTVITSDDG